MPTFVIGACRSAPTNINAPEPVRRPMRGEEFDPRRQIGRTRPAVAGPASAQCGEAADYSWKGCLLWRLGDEPLSCFASASAPEGGAALGPQLSPGSAAGDDGALLRTDRSGENSHAELPGRSAIRQDANVRLQRLRLGRPAKTMMCLLSSFSHSSDRFALGLR